MSPRHIIWIAAFLLAALPAVAEPQSLGPKAAKGLIIHTVAEDAAEALSPTLMRLRDEGWDVEINRVSVDFAKERELATPLFERTRSAEAEGYAKVVLAGESFGAWISLLANSSWTTPVERGHLFALIAMDASAASLGSATSGRWYEYKFMNVLKSQDATRLAVFLYDAPPEDRLAREDEIRRMLANPERYRLLSVESVAAAGPEGPHSTAFMHRWEPCLVALLADAAPAACVPEPRAAPPK
ncbi:conserved exported hypothetical protein [Candidatus Terasakiella magnetica]|nr:conserved exported hypothetical protein [Candidatus Terasakiella magnetica]